MVPERFGCCHGSDQACGVIASFVRCAVGWTTAWGEGGTGEKFCGRRTGGGSGGLRGQAGWGAWGGRRREAGSKGRGERRTEAGAGEVGGRGKVYRFLFLWVFKSSVFTFICHCARTRAGVALSWVGLSPASAAAMVRSEKASAKRGALRD